MRRTFFQFENDLIAHIELDRCSSLHQRLSSGLDPSHLRNVDFRAMG
jgi:hypothetical protein